MQFKIKSDTGANEVEVLAYDWSNNPSIGKKSVVLNAGSGNLWFHHALTTEQARSMAAALISCANFLEQVQS